MIGIEGGHCSFTSIDIRNGHSVLTAINVTTCETVLFYINNAVLAAVAIRKNQTAESVRISYLFHIRLISRDVFLFTVGTPT